MNLLDLVSDLVLRHPDAVYCSTAGFLLGAQALALRSIHRYPARNGGSRPLPSAPPPSLCLPELVSRFDNATLHQLSDRQLYEAEALVGRALKMLEDRWLLPEDVQLQRKLRAMTDTLLNLITIRNGCDGMTRLKSTRP